MPRSIASTGVASGSSRNRGILMLAAVFGILSAALIFAFLNSRGGGDSEIDKALNSGATESVLVVTRDISAGQRITSDMVAPRSLPVAALLTGRVQNAEDAIGKVTTAPLYKDEQVVTSKVTTYEGQNTLSYKVPPEQRALGLQVPHEAWIVGGLVQPGDRVDVLGLTTLMKTDPLTGSEKPDVVAGVIAENVEVLAVSQTLVKKVVPVAGNEATATSTAVAGASPTAVAVVATDADGKPLGNPDSYESSISVTLALKPDEAAKVAIIDAMKDDVGQWRLLPRQKGDENPISGPTLWSFDEVFKKK